jgi:hypothetical protein
VTLDELRLIATCLANIAGEHRPAARKALEQVFAGSSQQAMAEAVRRYG